MFGSIVNGNLVRITGDEIWIGLAETGGAIYPGGLPDGVAGVNIPGAWLRNPAKRAEYGFYPLAYTGSHGDPVRFVNGEAAPEQVGDEIVIALTATPRPEEEVLAVLKPQKRAAVVQQLAACYAAGYSHDFGAVIAICEDGTEMEAGIQVLQTRDMEDRTNWLILESGINDLLAVGQGATAVTIRTEENCLIDLPASDAKAVLVAMKQSGAAKLAQSWALKNAIEQATTLAEFDAIDVTAGWPA